VYVSQHSFPYQPSIMIAFRNCDQTFSLLIQSKALPGLVKMLQS